MLELIRARITERMKEFSSVTYFNGFPSVRLGSGSSKSLSRSQCFTPMNYSLYTLQHLDSSLSTNSRGRLW